MEEFGCVRSWGDGRMIVVFNGLRTYERTSGWDE